MPRRKNWQPGNVVRIDLGNGQVSFGIVIESPLMAFLNIVLSSESEVLIEDIAAAPVAFKIWVMKYAIGKDKWPVIGTIELSEGERESPWFYKYDMIAKRFSIMRDYEEKPATREECLDLECAAVWDPVHVESRLVDMFNTRPNKWVASLSARNIAT